MCNYKYEFKRHQLTGAACIYPAFYAAHATEFSETKILPVDTDGYCIFHSSNRDWKIENGVNEKFIELLHATEKICRNDISEKWPYNFSGFDFCQEADLFQLTGCPEGAALDFRFCKFQNGLTISKAQLKSIDIAGASFDEILSIADVQLSSGINATGAVFNNGIAVYNGRLEGHNYFDGCSFKNSNNKPVNNFRFKDISAGYLNFDNSTFETSVTFEKMIFNDEAVFDSALFKDEFYFHYNEVNAVISFKETVFQLAKNANPTYSTVDFKRLQLTAIGSMLFKGKVPFDNMVHGEMEINFAAAPEGRISFENFNLNKIAIESKLKLFVLEKTGQVEIGQGCRKYYCQTDIFEASATRPDQALILDLVHVFCNYFEIHNHYNLGIEIVERKPDIIRYFFFTDEVISKEDFEKRIKQNEHDLWKTFSNLSEYAGDQLSTNLVVEINELINIAAIFLKIRNRVQAMDYNEKQLDQLVASIAVDGMSVVDKKDLFTAIGKANASFYKELPPIHVAPVVYNDHSVTVKGKGHVVVSGQGSYSVQTAAEDPEMKVLAKQSMRWTKKQTIWTIVGVIIATVISIVGLYLAGYL